MTAPLYDHEKQFQAMRDAAPELCEALRWFDRHGETLQREVLSAHSGRGAAASEWMREDDSDFRADLRKALTTARAVLAKARGEQVSA